MTAGDEAIFNSGKPWVGDVDIAMNSYNEAAAGNGEPGHLARLCDKDSDVHVDNAPLANNTYECMANRSMSHTARLENLYIYHLRPRLTWPLLKHVYQVVWLVDRV